MLTHVRKKQTNKNPKTPQKTLRTHTHTHTCPVSRSDDGGSCSVEVLSDHLLGLRPETDG